MNGGDLVAEVLLRQGVRFLYTLCGGHISPILVSSKARGIRVIDVRHEATAVFAADATARLTGVPGVAAVTAGPGLTNTITAVKNAQLAESPVVVLGGATATMLKGRGALQDIDQMALMRPHVKWAGQARRVKDLVPALEWAFVTARAGVPGPVFLECPVDLLYDESLVRGWYGTATKGSKKDGLVAGATRWYVERHLRRVFSQGNAVAPSLPPEVKPPAPSAKRVRRAAEMLAQARRPVMLVGSQAMLRPVEVQTLAQSIQALGVPVYLSGMARGLLGVGHALQLRHKRRVALREADLVILAGTPCDFRLDYGRQISRRTKLISVNRGRKALRKNRRPTLAVRGAPDLFLCDLAKRQPGRTESWTGWLEKLKARDAERDSEIARPAQASSPLIDPLALCRAIEAQLGDNAIIVADGGDFISTASYILRPRGPLSWLDPGVFGTLGVGAGFALAAKLVKPSSEVWLLYGDGSAGYTLSEADTFVRHGISLVAVIGNDAGWTQIAREQVVILKDDVGTVLRVSDYHRVAEGFGAAGFRVDQPDQVEGVLSAAVKTAREGKAVYVNAVIGKTEFRKGSISM